LVILKKYKTMGFTCKIFGHKWRGIRSDKKRCVRCDALKVKVLDRQKQMIGEKCVYWKVYETPNFKKLMK